MLELARKVAETSTTILITGESGTGKDQLARLIHELSPRRDAPYLKIDCASLPQELVESELFGHERGAFTGAVERKMGRLEMADAGTIVLDEVAALSIATQAKLLRVLEERRFERLGGTETLTIEARLIALTNADLQRAVAARRFREDLYFRLSVLTIHVPALRERRADIVATGGTYAGAPGGSPRTRGCGAQRCRAAGAREIRLARQYSRTEECHRTRADFWQRPTTLSTEDLPETIRAVDSRTLGGLRSLEEIEREAIQKTLERDALQNYAGGGDSRD